jgi:predicted polyphosphate/ATP-dependent NAD kinase
MARIGFLINPIADMGGRVGLKGTDSVAAEAARRGAQPVANARRSKRCASLQGTDRVMPKRRTFGRTNRPLGGCSALRLWAM